jgi:hypothetical protein
MPKFQKCCRINRVLDPPSLGVAVRLKCFNGIEEALQITFGIIIDLHDVDP